MAKKKSGGSISNGRESESKRLGFKKKIKSFVKPGQIIIRQKGSFFNSYINTIKSKDYSIISLSYGYIYLKKIKKKKYIYVL